MSSGFSDSAASAGDGSHGRDVPAPYRFAELPDVFRGGKPQGAMDDNDEKRSKAGGWLIAAGLLLAMYVLSFGPMFAWAMRDPGSVGTIPRTIYSPLNLLRNTPLGKPLQLYVDWWLRMFPPPDCGICLAGRDRIFSKDGDGNSDARSVGCRLSFRCG